MRLTDIFYFSILGLDSYNLNTPDWKIEMNEKMKSCVENKTTIRVRKTSKNHAFLTFSSGGIFKLKDSGILRMKFEDLDHEYLIDWNLEEGGCPVFF